MTLKLNPFQTVSHNQTRMWRFWDHAADLAVGAFGGLMALFAHAPSVYAFGFSLSAAAVLKLVWFDWHRTTGQLLHPSALLLGIARPPWLDILSDFGLCVLGAAVVLEVRSPPSALLALAAYYALSTFNGT